MNSSISTPTKHAILMDSQLSDDEAKKVFRVIYAGDSSLSELYTRPVFVKLIDIEDINRKIQSKLERHFTEAIFSCVTTYDNGKSSEKKDFENFVNGDFSISDRVNSISMHWRFPLAMPGKSDPKYHNINIRVSSTPKPHDIIQAMLSRDPDEIDAFDYRFSPMSARIEYQDPNIAQEILDIIAEWNKCLSAPEITMPSIRVAQRHAKKLSLILKWSNVFISLGVSYFFLNSLTKSINPNQPATNAITIQAGRWLIFSFTGVLASYLLGQWLSTIFERHLLSYGNFSPIILTKGDEQRQVKVMGKNHNSFVKFSGSAIMQLIYNILGGIVCYKLFNK